MSQKSPHPYDQTISTILDYLVNKEDELSIQLSQETRVSRFLAADAALARTRRVRWAMERDVFGEPND